MQLAYSAGHNSVRMKSPIDLSSRTEVGVASTPGLKTSVHPRAVSSETYNVGMKNKMAKTMSGTSAAGVPSLYVSFRAAANRVGLLDYLRRDEGIAQQDPEQRCHDGNMDGGENGERGAALQEDGRHGDYRQSRVQGVGEEEHAQLDSSDGRFTAGCAPGEGEGDERREARDDHECWREREIAQGSAMD